MKRYCTIISLALFGALFVYLVFRSQHTVVNILLSRLSGGRSVPVIAWLRLHCPLPDLVIYSLPEGLWVFAATLVSKHLFIGSPRRSFHLAWTPLLYTVSLEFLQRLHLMPGSFDLMDILLSGVFCLYAILFVRCPLPPQYLFARFNYRTFFFVYIYAIVFLSHVST